MTGPDVIADASETIRARLKDHLGTLANVQLHPLQPAPGAGRPVVTVSLWEVAEDPSVRNRPPVRRQVGDEWQIRAADLGLLLRYAITAWGPQTGSSVDVKTEQQLLGRVAEFFYRRPILSGPDLTGVLAGTSEALGTTMNTPSLEDRGRIWQGVSSGGLPVSLYYDVRVVNLSVDVVQTVAAVRERRVEPMLPEVRP